LTGRREISIEISVGFPIKAGAAKRLLAEEFKVVERVGKLPDKLELAAAVAEAGTLAVTLKGDMLLADSVLLVCLVGETGLQAVATVSNKRKV
jgi:hypothetical protein